METHASSIKLVPPCETSNLTHVPHLSLTQVLAGRTKMSVVNKPDVSRSLARFYVAIIVFVAALSLLFVYLFLQSPQIGIIIGLIVIVAVELIMVSLVVSIYRTTYTLTQKELVIRASILIGGTKRVPLETVESAERTLIPFGIRLFGASAYGGYWYFPNVGRAFVAMTNFKDGLLIKAQHGMYLITPKNPESFKESLIALAESEKRCAGEACNHHISNLLRQACIKHRTSLLCPYSSSE